MPCEELFELESWGRYSVGMPLSRYLVRNEFGLADPELYRSADKDDPEALLEGVAMAGLVGVLRQLGDLAELVPIFVLSVISLSSMYCFLLLLFTLERN